MDCRFEIQQVTFDDIKEKMISICPSFKASYSWLKGFLKRFGLSLRTICSSSSNLSKEQVKERIQSFGDFMKKHSHDRRVWIRLQFG